MISEIEKSQTPPVEIVGINFADYSAKALDKSFILMQAIFILPHQSEDIVKKHFELITKWANYTLNDPTYFFFSWLRQPIKNSLHQILDMLELVIFQKKKNR